MRAMPRWQIACAGSPPISLPSKRIEPASGAALPAIRLKVVLLPEPLGPMRPRISPCAHFEGHLIDRQESSEALGKPLDCQHRPSCRHRSA